MSRYVDLGIYAESGKPFCGDLDIILRSNVLAQANSGGGKSWLLRRFIEQAFKRVPQIIIDPEGEFSTLRSHFDVVLVGKGGDTPADIRSAKLLAHRLLELGTSAVIDLYEMSKPQRPVWVAAFLSALIDAPKKLWRDFLIYIDEAHEFAPEPGHGTESRDEKVCRHALIDLAAKGRKRGYGVVAATQRLGKLSKDFAAELKNVLIGQTFIDIDRERAAGNLGVAKANKPEFFRSVMKLEPGAFFAFGRAFVLEPTLVTIGDVQTEHPEAGRRQSAPPPPTDKIRHLLPQLADLPKEAEDKLQTEKELRGRIRELEIAVAEKPAALVAVASPKTVEKSVLKEADMKRIERLVDKLAKQEDVLTIDLQDQTRQFEQTRDRLAQAQQAVVSELGNLRAVMKSPDHVHPMNPLNAAPRPRQVRAEAAGRREADGNDDAPDDLPSYALDLLNVVAQRGKASDAQISTLSGYRRTSSAFPKMLGKLIAAGLVTGVPAERNITAAGRARAGAVAELPTGRALLDHWLSKLTGYERLFLQTIHAAGTITREDLSAQTQRSMSSSAFSKTIGALQRLALIEAPRGGDLTIAESFQ
jgi:hypothetical protein